MVKRRGRKNKRAAKNGPARSQAPRILQLPGAVCSAGPVTFVRTYVQPKVLSIKLDKQSQYFVGQGTQGYAEFAFSISSFIEEEVQEVWDSYRFEWICMEALYNPIDSVSPSGLSNLFQPVYLFASFDPTGALDQEQDWIAYSRRGNLSEVAVFPNSPKKKIMKVVPAAIRSPNASSPEQNVVLNTNLFYDMVGGSTQVKFGKICIYAQSNTFNSIAETPFVVDFRVSARITLKGPRA